MEYLNRKFIIDIAIKGLMLFLGLIIFLFLILGEKTNNEDFVYRLYDNAQDIYFISTFFFAYAEMLVLLYIRDKKINDKATHYISIIYSFIVSFILYLNIDSDDERYLGFSNFIFLFITIEITYFILMYKEDDLRRILPNGNIKKNNNIQNQNKDKNK